MPDTVTIRLTGPLRRFLDTRAGENGLYESASEYLRDLVRRDFEKEESHKWSSLLSALKPAITADESAFIPFNMDDMIAEAESEDA